MTKNAKTYIAFTIASGLIVVFQSLVSANGFPLWQSYSSFCLLGLLASLLKVRLPGVTGTISVNFLLILVSTAMFSFTETVVLSAVSCLVQCLFRTRRKPKLVQVAFNVAALVISSALTYRVAHFFAGEGSGHLPVLLSVAASFYFATNTLMVCGVLALIEKKRLFDVWQQCYLWSFPYYLIGAGIAGLVVFVSHVGGLGPAVAILPSMYMVYLFYRGCVERMTRAPQSAA